jgi:hypothetical protein
VTGSKRAVRVASRLPQDPAALLGAPRIARVVADVGVPASVVYLNLEGNTRVHANHYEIWWPENARRFKLAPLAPAGN